MVRVLNVCWFWRLCSHCSHDGHFYRMPSRKFHRSPWKLSILRLKGGQSSMGDSSTGSDCFLTVLNPLQKGHHGQPRTASTGYVIPVLSRGSVPWPEPHVFTPSLSSELHMVSPCTRPFPLRNSLRISLHCMDTLLPQCSTSNWQFALTGLVLIDNGVLSLCHSGWDEDAQNYHPPAVPPGSCSACPASDVLFNDQSVPL